MLKKLDEEEAERRRRAEEERLKASQYQDVAAFGDMDLVGLTEYEID